MQIAVIGTGAVGAYFGGRLAQAGEDVAFMTRLRIWGRSSERFAREWIEAGVSTDYPSFRYLAGGMPTSRLKALRKAIPDS